jgi:FkbM family methyltransferase
MITTPVAALKRRLLLRQLPKVFTLNDFDPRGVRFEVTNPTEAHRVLQHGGETQYLTAMLQHLRADDVFYDIGANVGLVCLHAARRCRTVAFEPDPSFLQRLRTNLELNPNLEVSIVPMAIGDVDGPVTLFTDGAEGNSPSLVHQRGEQGSVQVKATTLDTLVQAGDLPHPTVLKLDIEGAEILALRGAKSLLHDGDLAPRSLFLEVHDSFLGGFGSSAEEVITLVRDAGYTEIGYQAQRAREQHLILTRP